MPLQLGGTVGAIQAADEINPLPFARNRCMRLHCMHILFPMMMVMTATAMLLMFPMMMVMIATTMFLMVPMVVIMTAIARFFMFPVMTYFFLFCFLCNRDARFYSINHLLGF